MIDEIIDPDCTGCRQVQKDYNELDKIAGDLAILVVRLSHTLRKAAPDNDLPEKAMDYLKRHDFDCGPLRKVPNAELTRAREDAKRNRDASGRRVD